MSYVCPCWKGENGAGEEGEPWEKKEKRTRELEKRKEVVKVDFSLVLALVTESALMWITLCYAGYKKPCFSEGNFTDLKKDNLGCMMLISQKSIKKFL